MSQGATNRRRCLASTLGIEMTHLGDFDDRAGELSIRVQSAANGGVWIFLRREA